MTFSLSFGTCYAADAVVKPPQQNWGFKKVFGTFDRAALQRGFQVYKEVCAACHGVNELRFEKLKYLGLGEKEIKKIASGYEISGHITDDGEVTTRPGEMSDYFPAPFPNQKAARAANNGAYPPNLSLIVKARLGGADYIHGLLVGYQDAPAGFKMQEGMYFNKYFPGQQIGMAPPLMPDQVSYSDGTDATVDQMARDVVTFLAWAAEPEMEERKHLGIMVLIYLLVFTGLMYAVMRRTWSRLKEQ